MKKKDKKTKETEQDQKKSAEPSPIDKRAV